MLNNVYPGDPIRAKDFNAIIDTVNSLSGQTQRLEGVRISAGPGISARGNAVAVHIPRAKRPLQSGIIDESDGELPFAATLSVLDDGKTLSVSVAGGMWYGNGRPGFNALPDFDAFTVPASEWVGIPEKPFLAIVLYAPARCGVLEEAPAVYLIECETQNEIVSKIRDYAYSTAAVIGVWQFLDGAVSDTPGQLLKSNFRYSNPHHLYSGFFGWSRCDGAKNTFRVNDGLALLRPHNLSAGQKLGDILCMQENAGAGTEISIRIPQKSHTLKTTYPDSEIEFLKKIALEAGDSTVAANVEIPTYEISASKKDVALPYLVTGTPKSVTHLKSVSLNRDTTSICYINGSTSTLADTVGLLTVKTAVSATSETLSIPTYSTGSSTVSYVDSVSASASGKTTVAIEIPTGMEVSTEIASVKPLTGATLETTESEVEKTIEVPALGMAVVPPDESTISAVAAEIFGETDDAPTLAPKLVTVPGTTLSIADSELATGAVVWLYLAVNDGNFSSSWHVAPVSQSPEIGDIPQTLALTVETKTVSSSTTAGADTVALAVKTSVDSSRANTYATAVPMAIITQTDTGVTLQRVREGMIDFVPRLAIEVNKDIDESEAENKIPAAAPGGNTELLAGTQISQAAAANAAAALARALSGAPPAFDLESVDFEQAEKLNES